MTDPIADMLTRIRNATATGRKRVDIPVSRLKLEIARVLQREGYIGSFKMTEVEGKRGQQARSMIRIGLKYGSRGENVISGIQRVSRPGRRVYCGRGEVPPVLAGLGINVLTTSQGVMTGREAVKVGVGGEVLCNVW